MVNKEMVNIAFETGLAQGIDDTRHIGVIAPGDQPAISFVLPVDGIDHTDRVGKRGQIVQLLFDR